MGTLGKALGCAGAYLASQRIVIDMLINRSRSFIFSTSLPPGVPAAAHAAIELVESEEGLRRRKKLSVNRTQFAERLSGYGLDLLGSSSQIVPVLTCEPERTMKIAHRLLAEGIFLQGIRPPTVAPGCCRLRATVMADHELADLESAADKIASVCQEFVE